MQRFHRDRLTWLAYFLLAVFAYFLNILGPITPFLRSELRVSYAISGLHFTAFAAGLLLVGLLGYGFIRKIGIWSSLWTGAMGMSLSVFVLVVGRTPFLTIGASFLMGTAGSLILTVVPSLLSNRHRELRSVALTEANVLASLISAAAPLVVGSFSFLPNGWHWALSVSALAPFLLFLFFHKVSLPENQGDDTESQTKRSLPALYWVYWFVLFLSVSIEFCMVYWSSDFVLATLGLSKANAAQSVSLFLAGMILGRLAASRLVRRFPVHVVTVVSTAIAFLGFGFYWTTNGTLSVLSGLFLIGLGVSSLYPLVLSLSMGASGNQNVKAGSRATLASGFAIMVLPFVLGSLADIVGIHAAYLVVPFLLSGVFLVLVIDGNRRRLLRKAS